MFLNQLLVVLSFGLYFKYFTVAEVPYLNEC